MVQPESKRLVTEDRLPGGGGGSGDVVGPASSVDNTLPRYNGTTGKLIQGSGIAVDDNNDITLPDGADIAVNATTGTKIGTATTQKLGFFNATPVVQQAAATELGLVLSNLGLRAAGAITDITVADGGTGRSTSTTAYGLIAAGTTATGAHQTISPGTSGQFLKSGGGSALGAFANIGPGDILGVTATKLLGRGSAGGTGPAEEIIIGSGLNLTGNTLTATGGGGGSGDVVGPASATDNTIPRFDSTTGKLIQGSGVVISDTNVMSGHTQSFNTLTQATGRLLGRTTASAGQTEEISISADMSLTGGVLGVGSGVYKTSGTDVAVADGGTGRSTSTTAYGIIAAGTTATGAHQTISPGTSGTFLKSAGTSALGSFAAVTEADISGLTTQLADPVVGTQISQGLNQRIHKETINGPTWYPEFSDNFYNPLLNTYNAKPDNMRKISEGRARVLNGGQMHGLFIGDSLFLGTGAAGVTSTERNSMPGQLARIVGEALGVPRAGGISPTPSASSLVSDRWTTTGASDATHVYIANTQYAEYTSLHKGTNIDIYISELGTAGGNYTIDGGAPQSISAGTGGSTARKISITGQTDTTHVVRITSTGSWIFVLGVEVWSPGQGLRFHNLAMGGSRAGGVAHTLNWTDTTTTGRIELSRKAMFTASGISPDFVVCDLGHLDVNASTSTATIKAALITLMGWYPNADWIFTHMHEIADAQAAASQALDVAKYEIADEQDCIFVDGRHRYGTRAEMNTAGLLSSDGIHPVDGLHHDSARNFAQVLAGDGPGHPRVVTAPTGSPFTHLPDGTLFVEYTP